jgi:hypothetical protein
LSSKATGTCDVSAPADVLTCLEAAYASRDVVALGLLYADNYAYHYGSSAWDRDDELSSAENMFQSPRVETIELTFSTPTVVPDDDPGVWWLEDVEARLLCRVRDEQGKSEDYIVDNRDMRFGVRETDGPVRFQIFLWEQPEP